MKIFDEWDPTNPYDISSKELLNILENMKDQQEAEINKIKDKIHQYEQKKKSEEAFYRSLSPLRRFFTGRAPNHHQAVEHIVHVKERMKKISKIKQRMSDLNNAIQQLKQTPRKQELSFSSPEFEEIKRLNEMEE